MDKLEKLKQLLDEDLITKKEYDAKKKELESRLEKVEEPSPKEEVKEEVEKPKKEVKKEQPKKDGSQNKVPMIIGIAAACLAVLALGGFFIVKSVMDNKPIKEVWGQTYFVYLKDIVKSRKFAEAGLPDLLENGKLRFYDITGLEDPVMLISYEEDDETYINLYYLEDGKVNAKVYDDPLEVEFLYNILEEKYDYYLHLSDYDSDTYQKVSDSLLDNDENIYTFTDEDIKVIENEDGDEIELSLYDETFVEVKVNDNTVDYNYQLKESELKNNLKDSIKNYQKQDDVITKSVQKEADKHLEELDKKQKEMEEIEANSYKNGLTNMDDALRYEISYASGRLLTSLFKNGATTITAQDLPDDELSESVYQYMYNKRKDIYDYDKVYTEDEIKEILKDLYGKNYTYDHKFTEVGACASLVWDNSKNGYIEQGGCGGPSFESDPYYHSKVLEKTDNTITIATMYVVPTADKKDMTIAKAPYKIYTDDTMKKEITSLNTKPSESKLDEIVEESGIKYKLTFDIDNGFYHFKEVTKLN